MHLFQIFIWSIIRNFTKKIVLLKTFNSEFLYIEVWFTIQNSKPLEIEGKLKFSY